MADEIHNLSYSREIEPLLDTVSSVKGVGTMYSLLLVNLDIYTVWDLLTHFPKSFLDFTRKVSIDENYKNSGGLTKVTVKEKFFIGRYKKTLKVKVYDCNNNFAHLLFFNRSFYDDTLEINDEIYIYGKFIRENYGNLFSCSDFRIVSKDMAETYPYFPHYALTKGITSFLLARFIKNSFEQYVNYIPEFIPPSLSRKYNFPTLKKLFYKMHFPESLEQWEKARQLFAYTEFFIYMLKINLQKRLSTKTISSRIKNTGKMQQEFIKSLPYRLTPDQQKVINEVNTEYCNPHLINRLIQGDVGSGKTAVAFCIAMLYIEAGYQIAVMAPTEILAFQHYENFNLINSIESLSSCFLSASQKKSAREAALKSILNGEISIVFGTHVLISDEVKFKNLKLAIIDEQQKFGVDQRLKLREKGKNVDLIVLTATPIPRSLHLTLYGDLDISVISSMPFGRKKIKTMFIPENKWDDIVSHVNAELKNSGSGYFVYPAIGEDNVLELKSAEKMLATIQKSFPDVSVGLIHGKMKQSESDAIMDLFRNNAIKILVATTIVSVGIDVKHATFIVIEQAERYGLSTLHQLRGRIGRNNKEGICILTCSSKISDIAQKRIQKILETDNGFAIAEFDFRLRGPGEVFGFKQSGELNFKSADFYSDHAIFKYAADDSKICLLQDPNLSSRENRDLKDYLVTIEKFTDRYLFSG